MSFLNRVLDYARGPQILTRDCEAIAMLDIDESGCDKDDVPYIILKSGEIFFSFLPSEKERKLYQKRKKGFPKNLSEDAFRVALDIIQRYFRENSFPPIPPKSNNLFPGWGFIDLGAYIGHGSMKCSRKIGPDGKVVAVEASPDAFWLLQKNIEANNLTNITAVHAAVQDKTGTLDFFVSSLQNNSIHKNLKDQLHVGDDIFQKSVKVPAKTVDIILEEVKYPTQELPSFVSFEINGAEPAALRGMEYFLKCSPRFDLRIAARYSGANNQDTKNEIRSILAQYIDISIIDVPPYIYAHKYYS